MRPWVVCPECGRVIAARVPKDGDGSVLRPVWHRATPGDGLIWACDGRFADVSSEAAR